MSVPLRPPSARHSRTVIASTIWLALFGCHREPPMSRVEPAAASTRSEERAVSDRSASPESIYEWSPAKLIAKQTSALDGDDGAADDVVEHMLRHEQWIDAEQWISIAAEDGSEANSDRLAESLIRRGGSQNCHRARFWLKRARDLAARNGDTVNEKSYRAAELNLKC